MASAAVLTRDEQLRELLAGARSVAVVGLSPKPERDSYRVAAYMQARGYRIIPVRPAQGAILGVPAVASLDELSEPVDIINLFRAPEQVLAHAYQALRLKPRAFWMQLGIRQEQAAALLTAAGIDVIMDRCIKIEHARLFPQR
jgi:hypothetical protein